MTSASAAPTWIAASPMPGASYMVSNMSSTSLRISGVDLLDRLGDQPQLLVGQDDDFAEGHGRDLSRAIDAVNAAGTR